MLHGVGSSPPAETKKERKLRLSQFGKDEAVPGGGVLPGAKEDSSSVSKEAVGVGSSSKPRRHAC